jgi:hypothetical protein
MSIQARARVPGSWSELLDYVASYTVAKLLLDRSPVCCRRQRDVEGAERTACLWHVMMYDDRRQRSSDAQ